MMTSTVPLGRRARCPLPCAVLPHTSFRFNRTEKVLAGAYRLLQAYLPWQCLYFLPEPHGQSSLRPILPQLAGFLGSRSAVAAGTSEALANAISSSPVFGSSLCASMAGNAGC